MIGSTVHDYEILEHLGAGGMGVVYKARDTKLDRFVALKFLPPELSRDEAANRRFIQEAKAVTALDHPNICRVHDIRETEDGRLFIVMAFYDGQTLKYRLEPSHPEPPPDGEGPRGVRAAVSVEEALSIGRQIALGLDAAHKKGIVHRDIKPANIMVTDEGEVKILDFGIAKLSGVLGLTRTGSTLGTTYYMSPEQMRSGDVDHRSDIWSLGVVLYQMLTGERPFVGDYDQAIGYAILNTEPDLSAIDAPDARAVVEACIRKDPEERFASTREVAEALAALSEGSRSATISLPRRRVRSRVAMGLSAFVVAVVLLATWFVVEPGQQAEATAPERQMLIVLPFENLGDSTDQYFADGMAEELSTRLSSISSIGVISRVTANRYRGVEKTAPEIGEELGVDYIVGGTVRWAEQPDGSRRVRITPYLTRVSDDVQLWAESYDRRLADVLDIQREVARQIVDNLEATIEPEEAEVLEVELTKNPDAYQEYLKGMELKQRMRDLTDLEPAIGHFEKALELDTMFPEAAFQIAMLAGGVVSRAFWAPKLEEPELWKTKAREAALHARKVAPGSSADLLANGYYRWFVLRDHAVALSLFIKALEYREDATVLQSIADIQWSLGNVEFANEYVERALQIDPENLQVLSAAARINHMLRQMPKSLDFKQRIAAILMDPDSVTISGAAGARLAYCGWNGIIWSQIRVDGNTDRARRTAAQAGVPNCTILNFHDRRFQSLAERAEAGEDIWAPFLTETYQQLGLRKKEIQAWQKMKRDDVSDWRNTFGFLASAEAGLGNREAALEALDLFKDWVSRERGTYLANYNGIASLVYIELGMYDEMFDALEEGASQPDWVSADFLRKPWFDRVRDDPRFDAVLKKYDALEEDWR